MVTLKPPFRAEDMHSLYKVVLKGVYPKIPSSYSLDLHKTVKALLQVNPKKRPTCLDILDFDQIRSRDSANTHTMETEEVDTQQNILLQTIYVPKNLMYLTDNLPKPKYEATASTLKTFGSDSERTYKKKHTIKSQKPSPKRIRNPNPLVLPDINNKDTNKIIHKIKSRQRQEKKSKQKSTDNTIDYSLIYNSAKMKSKAESKPSRVGHKPTQKSQSRCHSLDQKSNKSTHRSKEMAKNPSLQSLNSRDISPIHNKMSSAERIASKLSMNNDRQPNLVYVDSRENVNNLSLQHNRDLSVLGNKKLSILSSHPSSLTNSPRRKPKIMKKNLYNLHQYDYSIINKDSKRILSRKNKSIKTINKSDIYK
jgi:NIMA (never in mitosis gene a)-related kinase